MRGRTSAELERRGNICILNCSFSRTSDPLNIGPKYLTAQYSDSVISIFDAEVYEKVGSLNQSLLNSSLFGTSLSDHEISVGVLDEVNSASIKVFDLRTSLGKTSLEFGMKSLDSLPTCMAASSGSEFYALGTEVPAPQKKSKSKKASSDEDDDPTPSVLVYDARNTKKPLRNYMEAHSDDITALEFHPTDSNHLASAGSDGLVNIIDLKEKDEDDAIVQSLNCTSSVDKIGWTYIDQSSFSSSLFSITDDRRFRMWQPFEGDELLSYDQITSESVMQPIFSFVFSLKPLIYTSICSTEEGALFASNWSPSGQEMMDAEPKVHTLKQRDFEKIGGSVPETAEIIRCADFDPRSQVLVTGSECGILCATSLQLESDTPTKAQKKKRDIRKGKGRSSKPY